LLCGKGFGVLLGIWHFCVFCWGFGTPGFCGVLGFWPGFWVCEFLVLGIFGFLRCLGGYNTDFCAFSFLGTGFRVFFGLTVCCVLCWFLVFLEILRDFWFLGFSCLRYFGGFVVFWVFLWFWLFGVGIMRYFGVLCVVGLVCFGFVLLLWYLCGYLFAF